MDTIQEYQRHILAMMDEIEESRKSIFTNPHNAGRSKPMFRLGKPAMSKTKLENRRVKAFANTQSTGGQFYDFLDMRNRMRHQANFPACQLHPKIAKKHLKFWKASSKTKAFMRSANYGKGRVLFTVRENGTWQTFPWSWVPDRDALARRIQAPSSFDKLRNGCMAICSPKSKHDIWVHSLLIDGKRWDCINGWTD